MTSPGLKVVNDETYSTVAGMLKIICDVPGQLHDLAVQGRGQKDIGYVDLVGGDDLRADRHGGVEVLARRPLAGGALPLTRRAVHQNGVAGQGVQSVVSPDIATTLSDHQGELALVIEALAQGGLDQVAVRCGDRPRSTTNTSGQVVGGRPPSSACFKR